MTKKVMTKKHFSALADTFTLQTKLGPLSVKATQADHVYLSFGGHGNTQEPPIHVCRWLDGSWQIGAEYTTRNNESDRAQVVLEAFREWVPSHQDVFNAVRFFPLHNRLRRRQERITELRAEIAKLESEIDSLEGYL